MPNHKSKGKTTGLGIDSFIANLFETNEIRKKKLTDDQLAQKVLKEFPDRATPKKFLDPKDSLTVNGYRTYYNQGRFTQKIPPEQRSFRYNSKGEILEGRSGRTPLPPEIVKKLNKDQAKLRKQAVVELAKNV